MGNGPLVVNQPHYPSLQPSTPVLWEAGRTEPYGNFGLATAANMMRTTTAWTPGHCGTNAPKIWVLNKYTEQCPNPNGIRVNFRVIGVN